MAFQLKGRTAAAVPTPPADYAVLFKQTGTELLSLKNPDGSVTSFVPLPADGKIAATYLPSFVDDVLEYANLAALPVTGETGKIYVALDTGRVYRWTGTVYTEIVASPGTTDAITEGVTNLYHTQPRVRSTPLTGIDLVTNTAVTVADSVLSAIGKLWAKIVAHMADTANPHGVTKTQVGLSNADNTSDANKPVSTAQQAALDLKATGAALAAHTGNQVNPHVVTKTQVGLGSADDTSDVNKPVSTAQQTALDLKQGTSAKDASGGYAGLTLLQINFKNALNTFTSFLTNAATAARTYTFPDKDITVAGLSDLAALNAVTPTGGTLAVTGAFSTTGGVTAGAALNTSTGLNISGNGGFFNAANKFGLDVNGNVTRLYASGANNSTRGSFAFHATDSIGTLDLVAVTISDTGLAVTGAVSPTAGITFPATQNPSADANTLDDYEEGTWTPIFTLGGSSVVMAGTFAGSYTKTGRMVYVCGRVTLTAKGSSTGVAMIGGLPFTVGSGYGLDGVLDPVSNLAGLTAGGCIACVVNGIEIYPMVQSTTARNQLTDANFTDTSVFSFAATYDV